MSGQLSLDFPVRPALGAEDFLVAPCNRLAVEEIDLWPEWTDPVLALSGPAGSGKTHLAAVWAARAGAVIREASSLAENDIADHRRLAVENVDRGVDEEVLFHLINFVRQENGGLLLTGREPPGRWPVDLADLSSRLRSLRCVAIEMPDDATFAALLVKLLQDRQLKADRDVINFLVKRVERSFESAQRIVAALDKESLARKRRITIPLARETIRKDK